MHARLCNLCYTYSYILKYAFTLRILSFSGQIKPWLMTFVLRFSLPSNIICCSERVVQIPRQRPPSTNTYERKQLPVPRRLYKSMTIFNVIPPDIFISTTFRFDGQLSSEIPENWRTGKVQNINSPCSRTLFNSKLYWKRWCKRLPCSNGEDENVLHRRSNVNEIVSAGGKTSYQNARQLNRWITEKEPWQRAAIYVIFYGFYTIPSSAFDWSWDKTWAKHTAAT